MKLTDIDLNDREEIAAAHALLATILDKQLIHYAAGVMHSITESVGDVSRTVTFAPADHPSAGQPAASEVFGGTPLPTLTNAAAVFGGLPPPSVPGAAAGGLPGSVALQTLPAVAGVPMAGIPAAPPAFIAPAVQAQVIASVSPTVDRDKNGLPWDERIHAGTKTKNADGAWKKKKGVDDATVQQVETQLRAMPQSAAPLTVPAAATASLPMTNGNASLGAVALPVGLPTLPGLPGLPPQSSAGLPPSASALPAVPTGVPPAPSLGVPGMPAASTASPTDFESLMHRVTAATAQGILPPTATMQACTAVGLPNIMALQQNPAFTASVWAMLKASFPALQ